MDHLGLHLEVTAKLFNNQYEQQPIITKGSWRTQPCQRLTLWLLDCGEDWRLQRRVGSSKTKEQGAQDSIHLPTGREVCQHFNNQLDICPGSPPSSPREPTGFHLPWRQCFRKLRGEMLWPKGWLHVEVRDLRVGERFSRVQCGSRGPQNHNVQVTMSLALVDGLACLLYPGLIDPGEFSSLSSVPLSCKRAKPAMS